MSTIEVCYPWDETPATPDGYGPPIADLQWDDNPYTWDDVCVIVTLLEEVEKVGGGVDDAYDRLKEEDKRKFIEILYKVRGQQESELYFELRNFDEKRIEVDYNIEVTVEDIELVLADFRKRMGMFLVEAPKQEKDDV